MASPLLLRSFTLDYPLPEWCEPVSIEPGRRHFGVPATNNLVTIIETRPPYRAVASIGVPRDARCVAVSPGGERIATALETGLQTRDASGGMPAAKPLDERQGAPACLSYTPTGDRLMLIGWGDYEMRLSLFDSSDLGPIAGAQVEADSVSLDSE